MGWIGDRSILLMADLIVITMQWPARWGWIIVLDVADARAHGPADHFIGRV